ncbi:hypothetical protein GCM10018980_20160 [Streptomyces capoamus]|uniref:Uncharacterized protein n=1 Tax=Streptomyces capoamus TaxID=68183 RepID=A0A919EUW8_9ACTN|nr:hypothetical protein GCM10010501_33750 [Streptomyces libani subsp. rufus]GHG43307.1 hypothetical protein GCM10018980_20160 [Streptomyces capoamus]
MDATGCQIDDFLFHRHRLIGGKHLWSIRRTRYDANQSRIGMSTRAGTTELFLLPVRLLGVRYDGYRSDW